MEMMLIALLFMQAQPERLAVVNGEVITQEQVRRAAAPQLEAIEVRRLQMEADIANDTSTAIEITLNEIIAERLLAAESAKRNLTPAQLLDAEADSKVPIPSDDEVERFWADNQSRINMTREQALPQIREYLRDQNQQQARAEYIDKLKAEYQVESFFEPLRMDVASEGHPTLGPSDAPVTIVEFSDFECPFCGALHPTLKEIEKNYAQQIRVVYRQFPLNNIHPNAQKAAEASLCAHEQHKFWELHDLMFTDQRNLTVSALKQKAIQLNLDASEFGACLDSGKYVDAVRRDFQDGQKAGVSGTPALFINGRPLGGNQPYAEIARIIDDELRRTAAKK